MKKKTQILILETKAKMANNSRTLCFHFVLTIPKLEMEKKKDEKQEQNEDKDEIINNNIINDNT